MVKSSITCRLFGTVTSEKSQKMNMKGSLST